MLTDETYIQLDSYTVPVVLPADYTQTSTIRVPIPPLVSLSGELIVVLTNTSWQLQPGKPQDVIGGPVLIEIDFSDTCGEKITSESLRAYHKTPEAMMRSHHIPMILCSFDLIHSGNKVFVSCLLQS